jgi:hypothetical protein
MKTFKHSGDLGDIVYSLSVIKVLGGGTLYLDIEAGKDDPYCQQQLSIWGGSTKFNRSGFDFLLPLLKNQSYIHDVKIYNGENIDFNLNKMRFTLMNQNNPKKQHCLLNAYHESFSLPDYDVNQPWLDCGDPIYLEKKIAVTRSPRYQGAYTFLAANRSIISEDGVFLGSRKEHDLFEWTFNTKIEFFDTNSALDVAKIISGCEKVISNSTFGLAVAVGLPNKSIIQEVDKVNRLTDFPNKKNMILV